jgi:hypothetical protein
MGDYSPYTTYSAASTSSEPEYDLPAWAELLTEHFPVRSVQFVRIFSKAERAEARGVVITKEVLHYITLEFHDDTQQEENPRHERPYVVYYMRIGNRVKIGTTSDIKRRLSEINPEELLATEAGGLDIEKQRHQQFASLWSHGEWFSYGDTLKAHIQGLETEPVDEQENECHTWGVLPQVCPTTTEAPAQRRGSSYVQGYDMFDPDAAIDVSAAAVHLPVSAGAIRKWASRGWTCHAGNRHKLEVVDHDGPRNSARYRWSDLLDAEHNTRRNPRSPGRGRFLATAA